MPTIFAVDALDAPCMDIYTSGATPYAGIYLLFPLMFKHFVGPANDGMLEARLLTSRDGVNFSYIGANGRDAFLPRGAGVHRPNHTGIFAGEFDAAATAVARGVFELGDKVILLGYGSQYTHGGYVGFQQPGGPVLSGLQRLELRKDGFGSLSSPNSTVVATARTVPLQLPTCGARGGNGAGKPKLQLRINVQTSIGGYFSVALSHADGGGPVPGFDRSAAQQMIGNFISAPATWGHPTPPFVPQAPTTCAYEEPGKEVCSGDYTAMTCVEAKKRSSKGCADHGCRGKPTVCRSDGICGGPTNGSTLCVLTKKTPPPPPPPANPLTSDLTAFSGKVLQLELEGKDFNLFSFELACSE